MTDQIKTSMSTTNFHLVTCQNWITCAFELLYAALCYVNSLPPPPANSAYTGTNRCNTSGEAVPKFSSCEAKCIPGFVSAGGYSITCVESNPIVQVAAVVQPQGLVWGSVSNT
jgi:hypothetical protein